MLNISPPILREERVLPFVLGACVTAVYFKKAALQGTPLKVHLVVLGLSALLPLNTVGDKRLDSTLLMVSPLFLFLLTQCFKSCRKNVLYFGGAALTQMLGMRLIHGQIIAYKQGVLKEEWGKVNWDLNEIQFRDMPTLKERLQTFIPLLDYLEDDDTKHEEADHYLLGLCEILSLKPSFHDVVEFWAKSIFDHKIRSEALLSLGRNAPARAGLLSLACPEENRRQCLEFEAKKFSALQQRGEMIRPPCGLDQTGIPDEEWRRLDSIFQRIIVAGMKFSLEYQNNYTIVRFDTVEGSVVKFPIRVIDKGGKQIVVELPLKCLGTGYERGAITSAYNLGTGEHYAVTPLLPDEHLTYQAIEQAEDRRGLPEVIENKIVGSKHCIFMPQFDCGLTDAISEGGIESKQVKLFVIRGILEAVANFHQVKFSDMYFGIHQRSFAYPTFPAMHGDIKTDNIVFNRVTKKVMLIDLGTPSSYSQICGSPAFFDPATARVFSQYQQEFREEVLRYCYQYGQKRDVWATGLVLVSTLVGLKHFRPNLPLFFELMCSDDAQEVTRKIQGVSQAYIDRALDSLKNGQESLIPLLKEMFQVDPDKRITMQEVLDRFDQMFPDIR